MSDRSQNARSDVEGRNKATALSSGNHIVVAGVVPYEAPPCELVVAQWAQIRRDNDNVEKGYREHQYRIIERSVILCAELEKNEELARDFIADCTLENLAFQSKKKNMLRAILSYVLVPKTQNQSKIVWKYVRVRVGNLTMTNHPIHLHGHSFAVSCTDGGWVPESAQWPEVTTDIPVGSIRAFDFTADNPGDWAFHCHKSHHTMNSMGHDVRNLIGVNKKDLAKVLGKLAPDAMVMGTTGGAMGDMEMPMPDNTLPMMTGSGQFGPVEMGGMFTVMKIREGLARDDYKDPGPYKHPPGTVAHEVEVPPGEAPRHTESRDQAIKAKGSKPAEIKRMKKM